MFRILGCWTGVVCTSVFLDPDPDNPSGVRNGGDRASPIEVLPHGSLFEGFREVCEGTGPL